MKTSPRVSTYDHNGIMRTSPLLPVPVRLVANGTRDSTGINWNRRVRNWMQS